jgi:hypothetical protein
MAKSEHDKTKHISSSIIEDKNAVCPMERGFNDEQSTAATCLHIQADQRGSCVVPILITQVDRIDQGWWKPPILPSTWKRFGDSSANSREIRHTATASFTQPNSPFGLSVGSHPEVPKSRGHGWAQACRIGSTRNSLQHPTPDSRN